MVKSKLSCQFVSECETDSTPKYRKYNVKNKMNAPLFTPLSSCWLLDPKSRRTISLIRDQANRVLRNRAPMSTDLVRIRLCTRDSRPRSFYQLPHWAVEVDHGTLPPEHLPQQAFPIRMHRGRAESDISEIEPTVLVQANMIHKQKSTTYFSSLRP